MSGTADTIDIDRLISERMDALLAQRLEAKLAELKAAKTPSMTIIATKGTLDWAYPPFILSSTAAALGWDVSMFFTFYGLELLKKDLSGLQVSPLGQSGDADEDAVRPGLVQVDPLEHPQCPAIDHPRIRGLRHDDDEEDDQEQGRRRDRRVARSVRRGRREHDRLPDDGRPVRLFAATDFIPEVKDYVGAATFLPMAKDADVSLFI